MIKMKHMNDPILSTNRRRFLTHAGMGLGGAVMGNLLHSNATGAAKSLDFAPKAKRVIFLFMAGAPSQIDLFDEKPELKNQFKKPLPPSVSNGQRVTAMTLGKQQLIAPTMFGFQSRGQSGLRMSELLPHLGGVADDLCIIKTLNTDAINHDPAKDVDLHRFANSRQRESGVLAQLRAGTRQRKPARLCGHEFGVLDGRNRKRAGVVQPDFGAAVSCRPSTRVSRFSRPVTQCCFCPIRPA